MKAFFDSYMVQNPQDDKLKAAKLAVDRVSRLFRKGGSFTDTSANLTNSEPLVYLEQEFVVNKLKEQGKEKFLMIAGTNLEMLAELQRVGLLDLSKICLPAKRPSEIIEKKIRDLVTKYSSP